MIAGQLLGSGDQRRCDAPPPERAGHRDLVNQRNTAAAESGIVGLSDDRDVSDNIGTARSDKARALRVCVVG